MAVGDLVRFRLAPLPTPLEPWPRLSAALGRSVWVKRDDLTGLVWGGSKVRGLELLVGDALRKGATALLTAGSHRSNLVRLVCGAAKRAGLEARVAVVVPDELASGAAPGDNMRAISLIADRTVIMPAPSVAGSTREAQVAALQQAVLDMAEDVKGAGGVPYIVPFAHQGAVPPSIPFTPLWSAGCASIPRELRRQTAEAGISMDYLVTASSWGTTVAGLLVGAVVAEQPDAVLAFNVAPSAGSSRERVLHMTDETARYLGVPPAEARRRLLFEDMGDVSADDVAAAIRLLANAEGVVLESTYTGKALAGLIRAVRRGTVPEGATVVFLHSGGIGL